LGSTARIALPVLGEGELDGGKGVTGFEGTDFGPGRFGEVSGGCGWRTRKRVVQSSSFGFSDFARTSTSLPLLERLFLGVTSAFGAFLRLGGVMIPGAVSGCFWAVLA
jgi:hypothetical protein